MEDETVEHARRRCKWEYDDYIYRGHILNGMYDSIFDLYRNHEATKDMWDALESNYMDKDASNKKILVSNFNNYKMADHMPIME